MRIPFVSPKHRTGGAEVAGMEPLAWGKYFTDPLRRQGFDDAHFIDAMTGTR